MINFLSMNGYGVYVFSAFVFTMVSFLGLYLIVRYQLKKEKQKFAEKFGKLKLDKVSVANKQKINKEILSASIFSKI
ncbi:heme exporter protein CcmD [Candidatus Pelagibacter communis]|uniref:heme exporter protein CcmD n=1 Tax=Pelagibacter ubique TaxID=198252 RepID=UPI00094C62E5|nr:heme exporter protein CcmD [Candidatus Pelagibacter ubique]